MCHLNPNLVHVFLTHPKLRGVAAHEDVPGKQKSIHSFIHSVAQSLSQSLNTYQSAGGMTRVGHSGHAPSLELSQRGGDSRFIKVSRTTAHVCAFPLHTSLSVFSTTMTLCPCC